MSNSPLHQWLQDAGYKYHCFISYPAIQSEDMWECAERFQKSIRRDLANSFPDPQVYLDKINLRVGDIWDPAIRTSLCESIAMVAICCPMYYHPTHNFCGLEWATMEKLSESRLPGERFGTIFPVIFRKSASEPLPEKVSRIQYADISRQSLQGPRYYTTNEYRKLIQAIIMRIEEVASAMARRNAVTNCKEFQYPDVSAFAGQPISSGGESFWSKK